MCIRDSHTVSPNAFHIRVAILQQEPRLLDLNGKQAVPYQIHAVRTAALHIRCLLYTSRCV